MMVKICGITNREDALAAIGGGASALGFNFYPRSPRYVRPETAEPLLAAVPAPVWKVGVFVNESPERVAAIAARLHLDVVQLHGEEFPIDFPPGLRVWKAVRVNGAPQYYPAEAVLLDGPASGQSFDWSLARGSKQKIIVAGGLDAENVSAAIRVAEPWGVDACSRLESAPGRKDHAKMEAFLKAALA